MCIPNNLNVNYKTYFAEKIYHKSMIKKVISQEILFVNEYYV